MKESIRPSWKTLLGLIFIFFLVFTGQVKAQDDIRPLLGTDIVIVGQNYDNENLPGDPFGWTADVEFDGSHNLVVWTGLGQDGRTGDSDIYGRFITTSGLFNGEIFPITYNNSILQEDAAVAFNGVNYLVVWVERWPGTVKGRFITKSGMLIGEEIVISPSYLNAVCDGVDVASNGDGFLVVLTNDQGSNGVVNIYGQRINGNGTLEGSPFAIGQSDSLDRDPSIFYGAGKYLVAWERALKEDYYQLYSSDIYGTIIDDQTGNQLDEFPIAEGPDFQGTSFMEGGSVGISFDGTNFIVVWREKIVSGDKPEEVHAALIEPDGSIPHDDLILYSGYSEGFDQIPRVAFDGEHWLVVWNQWGEFVSADETGDTKRLFGTRVTSDWQIFDNPPILLSLRNDLGDTKFSPFVSSDDTNFLITWNENNEQLFQLVGSGIPTASTDGPFLVTLGEPLTMDGSASFSPDGKPLTYDWNFGDDSVHGTTEVVTHSYAAIGTYTVTLIVNDGTYFSKPFVTTATVVGATGGGQNKNVDSFLTFMDPTEKTTQLPAGISTYDVTLVYGQTIDPNTLSVTLNGESISDFQSAPGSSQTVTINLVNGRNTLLFMIDGIRPDGHVATDRDRLTFVVK